MKRAEKFRRLEPEDWIAEGCLTEFEQGYLGQQCNISARTETGSKQSLDTEISRLSDKVSCTRMGVGQEFIWLHKARRRRCLVSGKSSAGGHVNRVFESEMDTTINGKRRRVHQHCKSFLSKEMKP